jgi:hypothetical protein
LERFFVPIRSFRDRISVFYGELPQLRQHLDRIDKSIREAALELGLQKQWSAVKSLEDRLELLIARAVSDLEFDRAVLSLETSTQNLLIAMNAALPGSQGSLL